MLRARSTSLAPEDSFSLSRRKRRLVYYTESAPRTCSDTLSTQALPSQPSSDSMVGYFLRELPSLAGIGCAGRGKAGSCCREPCGERVLRGRISLLEVGCACWICSMLAGTRSLARKRCMSSCLSDFCVRSLLAIQSALMGVFLGTSNWQSFCGFWQWGRSSCSMLLLLFFDTVIYSFCLGRYFFILSTRCFSGVFSPLKTSQQGLCTPSRSSFPPFTIFFTGTVSSSWLICGKWRFLNLRVLNLASELCGFLFLGGLVQEKEMLACLGETAAAYLKVIFWAGWWKMADRKPWTGSDAASLKWLERQRFGYCCR